MDCIHNESCILGNDSVFSSILNNTRTKDHRPVPILSIISFSLGCIGNVLAIIALFRAEKEYKKSIFYKFVFALTITDFLGLISTSPIAFAYFKGSVNLEKNTSLCGFMAFMLIFVGLSTNFLVAAMSIDRYILISYPMRYRSMDKTKNVKVIIGFIWIVAAMFAILPLFGLGEYKIHFPKSWCFFNFFGKKIEDQIFTFLFVSIGFMTILITTTASIGSIIGTTRKRKQVQRSFSNREARQARTKNDRSLIVYLIIVFLAFTICWTPFLVRLIINQMRFRPTNPIADVVALSFASWNQVLDPWVYLFRLIVNFCTRNCRRSHSTNLRAQEESLSLRSEK